MLPVDYLLHFVSVVRQLGGQSVKARLGVLFVEFREHLASKLTHLDATSSSAGLLPDIDAVTFYFF